MLIHPLGILLRPQRTFNMSQLYIRIIGVEDIYCSLNYSFFSQKPIRFYSTVHIMIKLNAVWHYNKQILKRIRLCNVHKEILSKIQHFLWSHNCFEHSDPFKLNKLLMLKEYLNNI